MARPTDRYGIMLEKYRDVDEDEILSSLTQEELQQLEGEIDREVLNKIPEDTIEEDEYVYSSSSDQYSYSSENEEVVEEPRKRPSINQIRKKNKSLEKQNSVEKPHDQRKRLSKAPHQFKVPPLRKAKSREGLRRQKSEEGSEMKKELLQAVKKRAKRRTCRANSSGISRRYSRKNSFNQTRRKTAKHANEEKKTCDLVKTNFITQEMLSLRPQLKKVTTREPAKVNDMLHGVSLEHITSGVKENSIKEKENVAPEEHTQSEDVLDDIDSPADEYVAKANDNVHRKLNARSFTKGQVQSDETMSSTTNGSTSAESYDVIGELSINPNSVEDTILRVWEDDKSLTEVNLNNIQNVDMEVFEELASAMECNSHVKSLCLCNVGLTDRPARALASMLKRNSSLETLNLESNFITGDAALRLVVALRRNTTLTELRIDNQRHIFGAKVEHEFSKILKDNKTLLRFGYQFANPGPRMAANNTLTRNMDDVRKKRVVEQRRRPQAGQTNQPPSCQQASSEWHRKEKAAKLKQMKQRWISVDQTGAFQDKDVQKVLNEITPSQYALLEEWFVTRLLGRTEESYANEADEDSKEMLENTAQQNNTLFAEQEASMSKPNTPHQSSPPRISTPQRHFSPESDTPILSKARPMSPAESDSASEKDDDEQKGICSSSEDFNVVSPRDSDEEKATEKRPLSPLPPVISGNVSLSALQIACRPVTYSSSLSEAEDILSWKEGDEYDSDEYEIIEIEITETEESSSESDDVTKISSEIINNASEIETEDDGISGNLGATKVHSDVYRKSETSETSDNDNTSEDENEMSPSKSRRRRKRSKADAKQDAIKALDRLHIFDKYNSLLEKPATLESPKLQRREEESCSSTSSMTSSNSCSSPRPVRDDDSWMLNRPYYRLGAK